MHSAQLFVFGDRDFYIELTITGRFLVNDNCFRYHSRVKSATVSAQVMR